MYARNQLIDIYPYKAVEGTIYGKLDLSAGEPE